MSASTQSEKKKENENHTLLYVGAGHDMSFPFHKTNILIDFQPALDYDERTPFLKELCDAQIKDQLGSDVLFVSDPKLNRWQWSSAKYNVTIIYYHSMRYINSPKGLELWHTLLALVSGRPTPSTLEIQRLHNKCKGFDTQVLPPEVKDCDILYVSGFSPFGVEKFMPNLKFVQSHCAPGGYFMPSSDWAPNCIQKVVPSIIPFSDERLDKLLVVKHDTLITASLSMTKKN